MLRRARAPTFTARCGCEARREGGGRVRREARPCVSFCFRTRALPAAAAPYVNMDGTAFGSNTREDRIRARRERIEKRKLAKATDGQPRGPDRDGSSEGLSEGKKQTNSSLAHIDRVKATSIEEVTTIRIDADNRENRRRIAEEDKRQDRLRRLQEEAIESGKRNAAVEMRWQELMGYNMPQELLRELNMQRSACEAIISSKDKLIGQFRTELKGKDEEYVKSLKQQGEDITQLIARMRKQYHDLQREYASELGQIEDAFMRERDELLSSNKSEIDSLFDRRRQMEIQFMEMKQEREEEYAEEIAALRVKDAEDYSKLKIKLETDTQTLEQQLEEMRATYQLNTEKLEYNYRVLTERDLENSTTLAQQKRKLARLKDALANYIQKYNTQDAKHKQVNQELTDEYRRITKQYKDLQVSRVATFHIRLTTLVLYAHKNKLPLPLPFCATLSAQHNTCP